MRCRSLTAFLTFCALAAPAAASAGQLVYHQENPGGSDSFGVMNEDGSGQRTWLRVFEDVPPSGGTRFVTAFTPKVSADGRRVVFTTSTLANKEPGCLSTGTFSQGVNVWDAGVVRRLSPPPAPQQGVSTFESDGAPAADGRIYYSSTGGTRSGCATAPSTFGTLRIFAPDGTDAGQFGTTCERIGLGIDGLAPNPANPAILAHGGCPAPGGDRDAIYVGPSGATQVARVAPESTDGYESRISSPAWSPDGGRIVSVEAAGLGPDELVGYAPDGSGAVRLTTAPAGTQLAEPVYVGAGSVAFTLTTGSGDSLSSDIYALPASCVDCPLSGARRLTADGRSSSPSWSPSNLFVPPAPPAPAPTPPAPGPVAPKPVARPSALRSAALVKTRRGLAVKLTLRRSATVTLTVTGVKPKRKARRTTRVLKAGTTTVRLTKVAGKRLRKGSYRVVVGLKGSRQTIRLSGKVRR